MKYFYFFMAVAGGVVPWVFFGSWFYQNGFSPAAFLFAVFQNEAAGAFALDVVISSVVFLVWSFLDAKQDGVKGWFWVLPANFLVGLSLALPVYLFIKEVRIDTASTPDP